MQRYLLRTGQEAFRRTKEREIATQPINSGYRIAHLHLDNKRTAHLVHRIVAAAFLGADETRQVNHKNGCKQDNRIENLEWVTDSENKKHAVSLGLNTQAVRVTDPTSGKCYPSISNAAKHARKSHRTVRDLFSKGGANA